MLARVQSQFDIVQPWCANRSIAVVQSSPGAPMAFVVSQSVILAIVVGLGVHSQLHLAGWGAGGWWALSDFDEMEEGLTDAEQRSPPAALR
ncbi:hypothetical protein OPT61_g7832 [Boeremia exigua]|uniref:Uncharacterized protein n=1 Tax=Boeremia exigua TaxID=749465 RepID=A0ACC2I0N7_9PLEO|nr:hypothetical protein OPT61_g7832 [Boeremia exigua]